MSRRTFLVSALQGAGAGAALVIAVPVDSLLADKGRVVERYDWNDHSYLFLVDISRCIGCGMCVKACKKENGVPAAFYRTWVERYTVYDEETTHIESPEGAMNGFGPSNPATGASKSFFVPKLCNHCKYTPCTQVCPVGASYTTRDGVVMVDRKRCIGCGYCVQACPYGSRYIDPESHTADKCTWCYHRITRGMNPACVQACPKGARLFGDRMRENDPVFEMVETRPVRILQPELLTKPQCYYLGADKEVR
ncbi:MAG: 4Fe-4S dicluster domain-containing protein [Deltaproteobacteria bacterium]|nr:4Fe-4S dicluster domain-containing protein [Deltaproteobacteria bacterium]